MLEVNFNWAEAIWTTAAVVGLVVSYFNLREAHKDLFAVEDSPDGNGLRDGRLIIARGDARRAAIRVGIFSVWVILGLLYGFTDVITPVPRFAGLIGLLATSLGLLLSGYLESKDRTRIMRVIKKAEGLT